MLDDIPASIPRSRDDLAFWVLILLYSKLRAPDPHVLGLGGDLQAAEDTFVALSWSDDQRSLLLLGRDFKGLIPAVGEHIWQRFGIDAEDEKAGLELRPSSTDRWAGWLDKSDIEIHLPLVVAAGQKLSGLNIEFTKKYETSEVGQSTDAASRMLSLADDEETGLCIVVSG